MSIAVSPKRRGRNSTKLVWSVTAVLFVMVVFCLFAYPYLGRMQYSPQVGDVVFQSLPRTALVNAIEGATDSRYSHCGIVAFEDDGWVVYEAYSKVERTPLNEFLQRGRNYAFAVYRLKPDYRREVPAILEATRQHLGKPYDSRYRLDDDAIYCSELIYKAVKASNGEELGNLVELGSLRWQPFRETIERIEGGPVPLERRMITPKGLSQATQLQLVMRYGY